MSRLNSLAVSVLRWPFVWGGLAALGFYIFINSPAIKSEYTFRYFQSHPVEHASMVLFFTAMAALIFKGIDVAGQYAGLSNIGLGATTAGGQPVSEAGQLLARLEKLPAWCRGSYLGKRLIEALQYVQRKGSADELDDHLRYAADLDVGRMQSSYSLVRIIIWAIPILGFLGTVMGITLALAELGTSDMEKSMPQVLDGLKVAFDTTALALALSIVLMYAQFITDRFEGRLLSIVDDRTAAELVGRFEQFGAAGDPQAAAVKRMAEVVVKSCERLVERQAELWRGSLDAAQQQWSQVTSKSGQQLEQSLAVALKTGLTRHAEALVKFEAAAAERTQTNALKLQQALTQGTETLTKQQAELIKQGQLLVRVVEATDQVNKLETALNRNLSALAGEHRFEETVLSLSAAIQLLTAQLHGGHAELRRVDLRKGSVDTKAA